MKTQNAIYTNTRIDYHSKKSAAHFLLLDIFAEADFGGRSSLLGSCSNPSVRDGAAATDTPLLLVWRALLGVSPTPDVLLLYLPPLALRVRMVEGDGVRYEADPRLLVRIDVDGEKEAGDEV